MSEYTTLLTDVSIMRSLVVSLLVEDPWCHGDDGWTNEGCHFCGSQTLDLDESHFLVEIRGYVHESTCPWISAMRFLNRDTGVHVIRP